MPTERLAMRKVKEVLRLRWECGLSYRQIAHSCAVGRATVADYVHRATAAGLNWEHVVDLDDRSRNWGTLQGYSGWRKSCNLLGLTHTFQPITYRDG